MKEEKCYNTLYKVIKQFSINSINKSENIPIHTHLRPGYTVRPPTENDIAATIALIYDFDMSETIKADLYAVEDILEDWRKLNPLTDAWVVVFSTGKICGYATLTVEPKSGRIIEDGYVAS